MIFKFRFHQLIVVVAYLTLFAGNRILTAPDKGVSSILELNPMDPTKTLITAASFLASSNTYEERQAYLEKSKVALKDLQKERLAALRETQKIQKDINEKKQSLRHQEHPDATNENLMSKLNEISDTVSEIDYLWNTWIIKFEDHMNFLESNKDLFDETIFKKRLDDIDMQARIIPDDLFNAESELENIKQKLITTQQSKVAVTTELQRSMDELTLDASKKESLDFNKKESANSIAINSKLPKKAQEKNIEDNSSYEFDKILNARKREFLQLKVKKLTACLEFSSKELECLRFKERKVEDIIKRITPKLYATSKDVDEKKMLLAKEEQKITIEKDSLDKEIEDKKHQREAIIHESNQLKSRLEIRKESKYVEESATTNTEIQQEIFVLETRILKLRYETEALDTQMEELVLKKKLGLLARDNANFQYLRVQKIFLQSNFNNYDLGKDFTEILKSVKETVVAEIKKQQENLGLSLDSIDNVISVVTTAHKADLKKRREELLSQKNIIFNGKRTLWQETITFLEKAGDAIDERIKTANNMRLMVQNFEKQRKELLSHLESLRKEINELDGVRDTWRRSPTAITWENLEEAMLDVESFVKKWFWGSMSKLNPLHITNSLINIPFDVYVGFLIVFLIFLLSSLLFYFSLKKLRDLTHDVIVDQSSRVENRYALFLLIALNLFTDRFILIYAWIFIHCLIKTGLSIHNFSFKLIDSYYISLFYLASIIFFFNTSAQFLSHFKSFNQKMNYFFFSEKTTMKNTLLLSCLFYSTSFILPFWLAVSNYDPYFKSSILGTVLFEGWKLLTVVTIFLFLDKDDVLAFIPRYGYFTWMLRKTVERFFYPLFFFCISIYVILSPCLGYMNLGWWLCWLVPLSVLIIAGGYFGTDLNRTYTSQIFLSDSDLESEVVEKFEHARLLYGVYIVLSFICIWIAVWAALAYLWTHDFKLAFLWKTISETWTISYGDNKNCFGLVQLCTICIFIFAGYLVASFIEQFILKKIFEIFKIDAGLENTISKLFQYVVIFISFFLALGTLDLIEFIKIFGYLLGFGICMGMRDQLADIFAGVLILLERQIEKDHYIEFNEDKANYRGTVHRMSIRSTTIRTVRNFFVSIPNKLLISRPIINWGAGRAAIGMEFDLKVAFGADPETICSIIKQIIYENPSIMRVPAALVRLDEFSEYGMVFFARAFLHARRVREQWDIAANIRLEILKEFKAQNIELAYPSTTVRFEHKDGQPLDGHPFKIRLDEEATMDDNQTKP